MSQMFQMGSSILSVMCAGDGPRAHLQKLAECIRWSYGAGIVLRLGNIARLELNYCVPMGVQSGDRYTRYYRNKGSQMLFFLGILDEAD